MNKFVLLSVFLVVFTYYGGKYVPKMLKDNKQVLLGFAVALLLCSFFKKDLVEGHTIPGNDDHNRTHQQDAAGDTMDTWNQVEAAKAASSPPCTGFFCARAGR